MRAVLFLLAFTGQAMAYEIPRPPVSNVGKGSAVPQQQRGVDPEIFRRLDPEKQKLFLSYQRGEITLHQLLELTKPSQAHQRAADPYAGAIANMPRRTMPKPYSGRNPWDY